VNEREWDAVAATFEEDIFNVPANDRLGLIAERVKSLGGKDKCAADVGCGIGRTLPLLATYFRSVYAEDISQECLALAARKHNAWSNISYHHVDLRDEVCALPSVDLVVCINVLLTASLAMRQQMLSSLRSRVKPGGHLLITTPSLESALYASHRLVQWNQEKGMSAIVAQQKASRDASRLDMGIVQLDGVPTKHYLREELEDVLREQELVPQETLKLEYPWSSVFPEAPADMGDPRPWNWLVMAQRVDRKG
jgi:2-polyprenyl-3-methyl-5-hydroxy-6-metoxy-1,4-benzoquinol methylase